MAEKKKKHNLYTVAKDIIKGKSDKSTKPKGEKEKKGPGNIYEAFGYKKKGTGERKATTPDIDRTTPKSTMPAPPYPKPKKIL